MVITDPRPAIHFIICDGADRFSRFIVDDIKLSPIWGDALPTAASCLEEVQTDAHPGHPSIRFLVPVFDGSLPKLRSLRLRNVPFWSMGMFEGLKNSNSPMGRKRYLCSSRWFSISSKRAHCSRRCSSEPAVFFSSLDMRVPLLLTQFTPTSRDFRFGFEGPPPHRRAFLCGYRDSSFLLQCRGTSVNVLSRLHADLPWIAALELSPSM